MSRAWMSPRTPANSAATSRPGQGGVGHAADDDRVGAELRRDLLGDAPGQVVAQDRISEDVVGQALGAGR